MAAPHVTGIAAMIYEANPDLTAAQVKQMLIESGSPVIDDREGVFDEHGNRFTYSLVNAEAAVSMAMSPPPRSGSVCSYRT